jgi:hypothetical protein
VPFEPLAEDIVNDIDNKFQCSLKGPDYLPFFLRGTQSKLLLVPPSHFQDPVPLYYKGPFQDLPSIHLQGTNVSGKKRKHLTSKRKSRFENTEVDVTTLYCEKTCHLKDAKSNDCGVMIGHVLYNVNINIFDNISEDLQRNIGVTKKDFYQFVKMNLNSTSHPYVIDMRNHRNGIRIKVVESTYFDTLPSTAKIYRGPCGRIHQGREKGPKSDFPGIMIAFLHADPFMHPLEVSWSLAEIFHTRLGKHLTENPFHTGDRTNTSAADAVHKRIKAQCVDRGMRESTITIGSWGGIPLHCHSFTGYAITLLKRQLYLDRGQITPLIECCRGERNLHFSRPAPWQYLH